MAIARSVTRSVQLVVLFVSASLFAPVISAAPNKGVRPMFDVESVTQSPFPSNQFTVADPRQATNLRVDLPGPNCATNPSDCLDVALLNQLDGFSTQPRMSIPFDGDIDPYTVTSDTVFLVRIGDAPAYPERVGINQVVWDPGTRTLYVAADEHLQQQTAYLLMVTNDVRDAAGKPIETAPDFRRLRHRDEPSTAYRRRLADVLQFTDVFYHRDVAAASLFTTGSVTPTLEKIRDHIKAAPAPAVDFNIGLLGERTVFALSTVLGVQFGRQVTAAGPLSNVFAPTPALQVFPGSISSIAFGKFSAMNFETSGAFIPEVPTGSGVPAVQATGDLFFNLFLPAGPRPAAGWPVAIFGHGFGDNKNNSPLAVASTLAARGIATIAINAVGHGFGARSTLTVLRSTGPVVLPAGGRGVDLNANGVIDSTEGLFATGAQVTIGSRDGLRQTVADLMQVTRAIQGGVSVTGSGADLDPNRIYYIGQSLGGIYGTILTALDPDVDAAVLNVPGGSLTDVARLSPSFRPLIGVFLSSRIPSLINVGGLNFDDNAPLRNQPPLINLVPGAVAIHKYADESNWLAQSGDPVAWAAFLRRAPLAGNQAKNVILQFARGDVTVPNPTTTAIIRSGELADRTTLFRNDLAFALGVGYGKNPHTFLTNLVGNPAQSAVAAQTQAAVFFATAGTVTIDPDGAGALFETPIAIPLPEDLKFIP